MKDVIKYLNQILNKNHEIVVACSGGPDSMCLLSLLCELKEKYNNKIIVCHVNHKKRIESEEEKEFVKQYCDKYNCQFEYLELSPDLKDNFHSVSHNLRYEFYKDTIAKYHAKILMTAHHGDDLMETILMRLTRGSSLKGYSGFQKETTYDGYKLIRPLITLTKDEILKYDIEHGIPYRIDQTNFEDHYTRNRYRHHLLPFLKEENPNVHKKYLKFSEKIYELTTYYEQEVLDKYNLIVQDNIINTKLLNKENKIIVKGIIEKYLSDLYSNTKYNFNDQTIVDIIKVINSQKPNITIDIPGNIKIVKEYNEVKVLNIEKKDYKLPFKNNLKILDKTFKITNNTTDNSNYIVRLNTQELAMPLFVRNRCIGDKMTIKNLNGTKKIKDILINSKIPKHLRDNLPILVDSNNTILWIPGLKKSQFCKDKNELYDIIIEYK